MKAMIFAAGKGTRLKPLTNNTPKALIKVNGVSMLEHVILKLKSFGVKEIIINVHYLSDQIIEFLSLNKNFGLHIEISNESTQLLDTGGGLKKASWFFNDNKPFILHNVDVLSNIDFIDMINFHNKSNSIVTLAVKKRESSRYFLFDKKMTLCGWKNIKSGETITTRFNSNLTPLAFSGIHIIDPVIFDLMKQEDKFSIVKTYLDISEKSPITGYQHNKDYWFDIGNIENLELAEKHLKSIRI